MKSNFTRLFLSAVLMMCCMSVLAGGDWTIIEYPTCSTYGTMQNPANTSELRLVPKLPHHFGDDGKCTVCGHPVPTMYNGTPATSLVTITDENYATYGLTENNKGCVMGWKVITTAEEFMRYINNDGKSYPWIEFNAFLAEDVILDSIVNLPNKSLEKGYILDGTGHTISNMYRSDDLFVGLYEDNNGTIRNLGLIAPHIVVSKFYGGCICGNNSGLIENCFVIDGNIEGVHSDLYGIANKTPDGQIINCYAISNKGNIGYDFLNSYGATAGNVPDDFYASTLSGLNANKVNGMTWHLGTHSNSYPVMMATIGYHPPVSATCTESGLNAYWYCTVCDKYFLDANHTQETTLENLSTPALGHDMKHIAKVEPTCVETGIKEHYHCDRCVKNFEDNAGTKEIDDLGIPIDLNNHSLSVVNDMAHCVWCNHDFSNFVSIDNGKPAWLIKENDEYFLKADFVLDGGVNYLAGVDFIVNGTFTYHRNVSGAKAGAWQGWYEPFDLQLDGNVLEKMDVAEVAGVLIDNEGNTVVAFRKIDTGWMKANTPYVFRPKDAILTTENLELKMTGPQLYSSAETTFYNMSTYDKFTFGGNYTARHDNSWYTLNTSGVFQKMKEGVNLKGQRFWMTITAREDIPYEYGGIANAKEFINFTVLGDDEPTGIECLTTALSEGKGVIYDLMGRKVTSIQSGQVYIMNGKKYIAR
ncbi:MAG: hypothetical protein MJY81_04165 [Bacteroidaceae bacterium]|nr:hypothetical protein [Bacteroidaceae bacterium]